jgi:hypothetical protein
MILVQYSQCATASVEQTISRYLRQSSIERKNKLPEKFINQSRADQRKNFKEN